MPFVDLSTKTVVCNLVELTGAIAETGTVTFQISEAAFDLAGHQVITPTAIPATLDGSGNLTVTVPCSDDPDITTFSGSPLTYTVTLQTFGLRATYPNIVISVNDASPVQLATKIMDSAGYNYNPAPVYPTGTLFPQG